MRARERWRSCRQRSRFTRGRTRRCSSYLSTVPSFGNPGDCVDRFRPGQALGCGKLTGRCQKGFQKTMNDPLNVKAPGVKRIDNKDDKTRPPSPLGLRVAGRTRPPPTGGCHSFLFAAAQSIRAFSGPAIAPPLQGTWPRIQADPAVSPPGIEGPPRLTGHREKRGSP